MSLAAIQSSLSIKFLVSGFSWLVVFSGLATNYSLVHADSEPITAAELVEKVLDQTRGLTSYSELTMTVNRPEWNRTSSFSVWTRGREDALIRFTAPPRDVGNATLKKGDQMWTFSPKVKRTVRLPKSMMSQGWAGSDFSYNDLSRSDALLQHYELAIVQEQYEDDHTVYTIDAVPTENAPVVWGKEVLKLRDDYVLLEHAFYDQDLKLVKWIETKQISMFDGRPIPQKLRMKNTEDDEKWTEIEYTHFEFNVELKDNKFTLFSLRDSN